MTIQFNLLKTVTVKLHILVPKCALFRYSTVCRILCSFTIIIIAEGTIGKGDSLDVYMKSVNERGAAHDIKLQINKLKKVHILLYIYVCVFSLGYVVRLSTYVHIRRYICMYVCTLT